MTAFDSPGLAGLFPGQGAQYLGMLDGFARHAVVRDTFEEASQALGIDLWTLGASGPSTVMNDTRFTQPLMLAAGVACWRAWSRAGGGELTVTAGHSLGEISACVAAGSFALDEAILLVRQRAELMHACVPGGLGGMAAVIGLPGDVVLALCRACEAEGLFVEAVNFNEPLQTSIAGLSSALDEAMARCLTAGAKRVLRLPVSTPFHTSLLEPVTRGLAAALQGMRVLDATVPVIGNVDAVPRQAAGELVTALAIQASKPVRWVDCLRAIEATQPRLALEFGPGRTLAGFAKKSGLQVRVLPVSDPASLEAALTAQDALATRDRLQTASRPGEPRSAAATSTL